MRLFVCLVRICLKGYFILCTSVCGCVHRDTDALGGQKRELSVCRCVHRDADALGGHIRELSLCRCMRKGSDALGGQKREPALLELEL